MAQNRLYLKCNKCGDLISIARLNSSSRNWSASANWGQAQEWADRFDKWLEDHSLKCSDNSLLDVSLVGEGEELLNIQHDLRPAVPKHTFNVCFPGSDKPKEV